ncbi:UNVERIFIED_CONTAM: hypothetical protein FKN15_046328 [Acipenser sinensis]
MERYESWLRDPSTPLWLRTEGRHLLGDSNLDILLDFVRLEPEVQTKAITRGYPGLIEALEWMTQMVDWVYQEREEREQKVRRRRQRGNTDLEWEEPERPAPEWEEPERPAPEWEEPERPVPKREDPERPTPKREEPERPVPKREEPERPTPYVMAYVLLVSILAKKLLIICVGREDSESRTREKAYEGPARENWWERQQQTKNSGEREGRKAKGFHDSIIERTKKESDRYHKVFEYQYHMFIADRDQVVYLQYKLECCRERPPDGAVESCSSLSLTHRSVFPTALEVYCKRIRPQHLANCSLRLHYTLDNK